MRTFWPNECLAKLYVWEFHGLTSCHIDMHTQNVISDKHNRFQLIDGDLVDAYSLCFQTSVLSLSGNTEFPEFIRGLRKHIKQASSMLG